MKKQLEFQEVIGYQFQQEGLLLQALTHSSYANEKKMKKHSDNERLEFLGDAVLEFVSSDFLYRQRKETAEGDLTKLRASMVCEPALAFAPGNYHCSNTFCWAKGNRPQAVGTGIPLFRM